MDEQSKRRSKEDQREANVTHFTELSVWVKTSSGYIFSINI